jgi:hypothetical protein
LNEIAIDMPSLSKEKNGIKNRRVVRNLRGATFFAGKVASPIACSYVYCYWSFEVDGMQNPMSGVASGTGR